MMHTIALLIIIVVIGGIGIVNPATNHVTGVWIATMVLMALFTAVAGHAVNGLWRGALIDTRNKISLSRLQMIFWTILVLSALYAAFLGNLASAHSVSGALDIDIPPVLYALMGISTTSLVASPLILSTKREKSADATQSSTTVSAIEKQMGAGPGTVKTEGQVVVNANPDNARFSDLFKGEESGNGAHLDLGKIQMLFFTVVVGISYAILVGEVLVNATAKIEGLPPLSPGLITMVAISHAGYLANKAVPHSKA